MAQVKLRCTDSFNEDGSDKVVEFELEYAERILSVPTPQKGWTLADDNYKFKSGKLVMVETPAPTFKQEDENEELL